VQIDEADSFACVALHAWGHGIAAKPLNADPSVSAKFGLEAQLRHALPVLGRKTGKEPRLLGSVEILKPNL
jgi:hypothetical protein